MSSPSPSPSASIPTSSTTPSTAPSSSSSTTTIILAVIIGVFSLLIIIGLVLFITRHRRKQRRPGSLSVFRKRGGQEYDGDPDSMLGDGPQALDWRHPAARITPFGGGPRSSPRFTHIPGADMRIANRRADGVWEFQDPSTPFTPAGISDLENTPPPSSSASSIFSFGTLKPKDGSSQHPDDKRSILSATTATTKKNKRYTIECPSPDLIPPPAYGYGYGIGAGTTGVGGRDSISSWGASSTGCLPIQDPPLAFPSPSYGPHSPQLSPALSPEIRTEERRR